MRLIMKDCIRQLWVIVLLVMEILQQTAGAPIRCRAGYYWLSLANECDDCSKICYPGSEYIQSCSDFCGQTIPPTTTTTPPPVTNQTTPALASTTPYIAGVVKQVLDNYAVYIIPSLVVFAGIIVALIFRHKVKALMTRVFRSLCPIHAALPTQVQDPDTEVFQTDLAHHPNGIALENANGIPVPCNNGVVQQNGSVLQSRVAVQNGFRNQNGLVQHEGVAQQNRVPVQNGYLHQNGVIQQGLANRQQNGAVQQGLFNPQQNGTVHQGIVNPLQNGAIHQGLVNPQQNGTVHQGIVNPRQNGAVHQGLVNFQPNGTIHQNAVANQYETRAMPSYDASVIPTENPERQHLLSDEIPLTNQQHACQSPTATTSDARGASESLLDSNNGATDDESESNDESPIGSTKMFESKMV